MAKRAPRGELGRVPHAHYEVKHARGALHAMSPRQHLGRPDLVAERRLHAPQRCGVLSLGEALVIAATLIVVHLREQGVSRQQVPCCLVDTNSA